MPAPAAPPATRSAPAALFFRAATSADLASVVELVESAYRGDVSRAGWTTEADLLDGQRTDRHEVGELVARSSAQLVLAFDAPQLVGCVLVRAKGDGTSHVGMFAVAPRLQSQGIGSALLAEAERVARHQQGARRAEMTVIAQRLELIAWYERRGYRDTGEREPFPYGDPRFGLPRREDLVFVVLGKDLVEGTG